MGRLGQSQTSSPSRPHLGTRCWSCRLGAAAEPLPSFGRHFARSPTFGAARDDAVLVASELVTNAVVHSGGSPADTIQIRAVLVRGGVSISVHDPGLSGDPPRLRDTGVMQAGGWGLRIVERLARRWGCERDPGHRVWAELATGRSQ